MTDKSTQQIVREWRGIDARRPGGGLPDVARLLEIASTRDLPEQERRLIEIIAVLHDTVQGYHAEMGGLIRDLHAAQDTTRTLRDAAGQVVDLYDDGDLSVGPHADRDRVRLALGALRALRYDPAPPPEAHD